MDLIKIAVQAFVSGNENPTFKSGDPVVISYRIIEGNKERVQLYLGVVIKLACTDDKRCFTLRNM